MVIEDQFDFYFSRRGIGERYALDIEYRHQSLGCSWRTRLRKKISMRVLIDSCVRGDAEIARAKQVSVPNMVNKLIVLKAVSAQRNDWHKSQIECLPSIARLAKQGIIKFCSSDTLRDEAWRKPGSASSIKPGDLFYKIPFENVRSAISPYLFFDPLPSENYKKGIIEFCNWIIVNEVETLLSHPSIEKQMTKAQIENLGNVSRFRGLCSGLSSKHYDDIFHIWSGEAAGIDCFLTTNLNLVRAIREKKSNQPKCEPLFPTELLARLGINEIDPMPFEYNKTYTFGGYRLD